MRSRAGALVPLSNLVTLEERAEAGSLNRFQPPARDHAVRRPRAGLHAGARPSTGRTRPRATRCRRPRRSTTAASREYLQSGGAVLFTFAMALLIVFLVLSAQFESFLHPLVIMLTVPLAVLGALLGLWLFGKSSTSSARSASSCWSGSRPERHPDRGVRQPAARRRPAGARGHPRCRGDADAPILMTSIATIAGALPLMLATGAGAGSRTSIGVVVVFGVALSTLLSLFVVPAFYLVVAPRTRPPDERTQQNSTRLKTRFPGRCFPACLSPSSPTAMTPRGGPPGAVHAQVAGHAAALAGPAMPAASIRFRRRLEAGRTAAETLREALRAAAPAAATRASARRPPRCCRNSRRKRASAHPPSPSRPARCFIALRRRFRACPAANSSRPWAKAAGSSRPGCGASARGPGCGTATRPGCGFADASLDAILCLDVLEHVPVSAALGEFARVLKPGGALLLTVPWHWTNAGSREIARRAPGWRHRLPCSSRPNTTAIRSAAGAVPTSTASAGTCSTRCAGGGFAEAEALRVRDRNGGLPEAQWCLRGVDARNRQGHGLGGGLIPSPFIDSSIPDALGGRCWRPTVHGISGTRTEYEPYGRVPVGGIRRPTGVHGPCGRCADRHGLHAAALLRPDDQEVPIHTRSGAATNVGGNANRYWYGKRQLYRNIDRRWAVIAYRIPSAWRHHSRYGNQRTLQSKVLQKSDKSGPAERPIQMSRP